MTNVLPVYNLQNVTHNTVSLKTHKINKLIFFKLKNIYENFLTCL